MDLDGVGSPAALAARIHELLPELPQNVPLELLCSHLDIASIKEIETSGFEAALVMDALKASGAILVAAGRWPERKRFSIAHELGHFLIPSHKPDSDRPFQCSLDDLHLADPMSRDRHRRIEAEANRFAAGLLMPPAKIRSLSRQADVNLQSIIAMARGFGVSKEAMARSWIGEQSEPVAIIVARNGKIERQYRHEDFPWLPRGKGGPLPMHSLALETALPGSYSDVEEIEPDTWLTDRDADRALLMTEQVLGQRNGYAMILLRAEMDEE